MLETATAPPSKRISRSWRSFYTSAEPAVNGKTLRLMANESATYLGRSPHTSEKPGKARGPMSRFLAHYESYVSKRTDAPREFGHAAGLACLSTIALGRRHLSSGAHPNLFILLVGPSSRDRKSTSISLAMDLIGEVDEKRIGPSDATPEGLMFHMRRKTAGTQKNQIIVPYSEFGNTLATAKRTYAAGMGALMCQLYDGETIVRAKSGKRPLTVDKPRFSMLGGVSYGMLEKYVEAVDWEGGFFARIVFVEGKTRSHKFSSVPDSNRAERDVVRMKLTDLAAELDATPGQMMVSLDARMMYDEFVRRIPDTEGDPAIVAQRERLLNTVMKFALLYAIDENPHGGITSSAMEKAIGFGGFAWESFRVSYSRSSGHPRARLLRKIWRVIFTSPDGIDFRSLYRTCHLNIHEVHPIIEQLKDMKIIGVEQTQDSGVRLRCLIPFEE